MSAIAVAGFWGAARWALGGWPPGFFWLFAIGELVSNNEQSLRDPHSISVGEW